MSEFLGKLSIADAMGSLYGDKVRVITALSGFIGVTGIISIQLKAAGIIFEYALDTPREFGVIIAGVLITMYSALGGIKSVTFTDIIQFITFGIVIPIILYFLLDSINNIDVVTNIFTSNPVFDYKQVFDFSQQKSIYFVFFFLFCAIPGFDPAIFQRISMAKSTAQAKKSFFIAALVFCIMDLTVTLIGILTIAIHPRRVLLVQNK